MAAKPTIVPRLVIIEGKDKGKVIPLYDGTAIIGRSKGDVVIQDPRVSRSHIAIHYDSSSQKLTFTDLKSLNSTLVNGKTAESGELNDGDKLQLGDTIFDCQIGALQDEETSVSKVKDTLKKRKESASKKKKSSEKKGEEKKEPPAKNKPPMEDSNAKLEPKLIPLEGLSDLPKEPHPTAEKKEVSYKKHRPLISMKGLKATYRKMPRTLRVACLCLSLIGFVLIYYGNGDNNSGTQNLVEEPANIEHAIVSINKLTFQNKLDEALSAALALKEAFPDDSRPYMALGNIHALKQENAPAIEAFETAHERKPDQPLVHIKLVRVLLKSGLTNKAQNELNHVDSLLKEGNNNKELFVEAAYLFLDFKELKQPTEKALILAKALQKQLAPESTIGYKLEAQALFQEKMVSESLTPLLKGLDKDPLDEWLLENTALAYLSLQNVTEASKTIENWIKLHPTTSKALLVMAYLKFNANNHQDSLPYIEKIIENGKLSPNDPLLPEALNLKAQILTKEKQVEAAIELFRRSCEAGYEKSCNHLTALESLTKPAEARMPDAEPPLPESQAEENQE